MGEEIDRCKYIHKHILVYIYIQIDKKRYTRIKKRSSCVCLCRYVYCRLQNNKIIFYSKLKNDENYGKIKK